MFRHCYPLVRVRFADLMTQFWQICVIQFRRWPPSVGSGPHGRHTGWMTDVLIPLAIGTIHLRRARLADLTRIIELLADDPISASRGDTARAEDRDRYERAFAAIDRDPAQELLVATSPHGDVLGTMQLTTIPGLARAGTDRLQIEAVRVSSVERNHGIGAAMIRWALDQATEREIGLVQLTSDAARVDAHRFYERLGFTASHVGFKFRPERS